MATFFLTLYRLLQWLIYLYSLVIVIYCLFSWVPALRSSKLGEILGRIVEPYLHVFHLPTFWGIDFSPVIALLVLYLVQDYVLRWLFQAIFRLLGY
ncbi:MAG: YggT family protein [Lactobacillus sp.]|jgi:YggT family protein|nr:YggT family protein [Lactobacillus sp.]MCH3906478.1 YggT family protein [Lactobacillus sp.]MCH3989944.1 YggT family protein [Lactobacillus sp.]MCH4069341.1 YggT family protein [Lactobacillus sp.]MCI1303671.1 YggT family protein [Lactobacillus sp.]